MSFDHLPSSNVIRSAASDIVREAQKIYDDWTEDNGSGICGEISDAIKAILNDRGIPTETVEWPEEGHAACVATCSDGIFDVDIAWSIYEGKDGDDWYKLPDVEFVESDLSVFLVTGDHSLYGKHVRFGQRIDPLPQSDDTQNMDVLL